MHWETDHANSLKIGNMQAPAPTLISTKTLDDDFFMFTYKIHACPIREEHDQQGCPYSHEGEGSARRDPLRAKYMSVCCPDSKAGKKCHRGDTCSFAHSMHEYWLHPSRYRTQFCRDGMSCKRTVCFFAHSHSELRILSKDVRPMEAPAASRTVWQLAAQPVQAPASDCTAPTQALHPLHPMDPSTSSAIPIMQQVGLLTPYPQALPSQQQQQQGPMLAPMHHQLQQQRMPQLLHAAHMVQVPFQAPGTTLAATSSPTGSWQLMAMPMVTMPATAGMEYQALEPMPVPFGQPLHTYVGYPAAGIAATPVVATGLCGDSSLLMGPAMTAPLYTTAMVQDF